MNELIQISQTQIGAESVNSVDARTLHETLELKSDFSTWVKKELTLFVEDVDYIRFHKKMEANNATRIEYLLSMDAAKHLSMIQRNSKGKECRDYFIEIEKQKFNTPVQLPSKIELAQMVIESETKIIALEDKLLKKDEVILAAANLNIRAGDVTIGDFSKNLAIEGLGRNNLFTWLRGRGYLMINTEPFQVFVKRGYFVRKPSEKKINGEVRYTTMLTPRGTIWLTKMLKAEYELD